MSPFQEAIGRRVRELRLGRNMSLDAMARAAHVSKTHLSNLEQGRVNPKIETLYAIAGALGVQAFDLLNVIEDERGALMDATREFTREELDSVRKRLESVADAKPPPSGFRVRRLAARGAVRRPRTPA
ncbi:helix-turn-helix domain-containing protein [Polyangium sp. y55x31]|uniref:helix-turn-helix domain-containing protein n=1 Tax=Polyangium sp. y55x31 TaxID=3042688 RepID=UPI00248296A9|nr:helix-turn-helix domain-containing protein [Polyangium sp. y55x31]MDI1475393.1 helix-turn-helix domain-containing protein [Polyangium sp. y55x31]